MSGKTPEPVVVNGHDEVEGLEGYLLKKFPKVAVPASLRSNKTPSFLSFFSPKAAGAAKPPVTPRIDEHVILYKNKQNNDLQVLIVTNNGKDYYCYALLGRAVADKHVSDVLMKFAGLKDNIHDVWFDTAASGRPGRPLSVDEALAFINDYRQRPLQPVHTAASPFNRVF